MTRQEHFDQWMRHNYPHTPLCYDAEKDCYIGSAFLAYQAWKEAPLRRPCERGQITKEQLKEMKASDDPKTIVDRLNGWYSQTSEPYVVPKIQKEAAREIERLRKELKGMEALFQKKVDDCAELDVGTHREIQRLREAASQYMKTVDDGHLAFINDKLDDKNRDAYCKLWNLLNKKPAEAG